MLIDVNLLLSHILIRQSTAGELDHKEINGAELKTPSYKKASYAERAQSMQQIIHVYLLPMFAIFVLISSLRWQLGLMSC